MPSARQAYAECLGDYPEHGSALDRLEWTIRAHNLFDASHARTHLWPCGCDEERDCPAVHEDVRVLVREARALRPATGSLARVC